MTRPIEALTERPQTGIQTLAWTRLFFYTLEQARRSVDPHPWIFFDPASTSPEKKLRVAVVEYLLAAAALLDSPYSTDDPVAALETLTLEESLIEIEQTLHALMQSRHPHPGRTLRSSLLVEDLRRFFEALEQAGWLKDWPRYSHARLRAERITAVSHTHSAGQNNLRKAGHRLAAFDALTARTMKGTLGVLPLLPLERRLPLVVSGLLLILPQAEYAVYLAYLKGEAQDVGHLFSLDPAATRSLYLLHRQLHPDFDPQHRRLPLGRVEHFTQLEKQVSRSLGVYHAGRIFAKTLPQLTQGVESVYPLAPSETWSPHPLPSLSSLEQQIQVLRRRLVYLTTPRVEEFPMLDEAELNTLIQAYLSRVLERVDREDWNEWTRDDELRRLSQALLTLCEHSAPLRQAVGQVLEEIHRSADALQASWETRKLGGVNLLNARQDSPDARALARRLDALLEQVGADQAVLERVIAFYDDVSSGRAFAGDRTYMGDPAFSSDPKGDPHLPVPSSFEPPDVSHDTDSPQGVTVIHRYLERWRSLAERMADLGSFEDLLEGIHELAHSSLRSLDGESFGALEGERSDDNPR